MKPNVYLPIGILALLFPLGSMAQSIEESCDAKYPVTERIIRETGELTLSDPRQFLIRRCISDERKRVSSERAVGRQQIRDAARFDRSTANVNRLRESTENNIQDAIRRQHLKVQRFRSRTLTLKKDQFLSERSSRRAIVQKAEGEDRINAIRRKMRSQNLPDPCLTVGVIRTFNSRCTKSGAETGN